jgi:hypothetical protein
MATDLGNERVRRAAAMCAAACAFALAGARASAQAPAPDWPAAIADAAVAALGDRDPAVRGEAALVAAAAAPSPTVEARLLVLAKDEAREARLRALLALGVLARPAAVDALALRLAEAEVGGEDAVAAAFALGLAASPAAETAIARFVVAAERGGWRRHREPLLALLLGMQRCPDAIATAALRRAFDDESQRDADVRALLVARLVVHDGSFDDKVLRRMLARGETGERAAALAALAASTRPCVGELLADVARIAAHDADAASRAGALATLARIGHPPALELAARAVRAGEPAEAATGLRALLRLGGAGMLRAAAAQLADERDPARAAALVAAYEAPPTDDLRARCAALADDATASWPLRAAAVGLLARAEPARGAELARTLFAACRDPLALPSLADAMRRADGPGLRGLLPDTAALDRELPRWAVLLATDDGDALDLAGKALAGDARVARPLAALRALRSGRVLAAPDHPATPAMLRALLAVE